MSSKISKYDDIQLYDLLSGSKTEAEEAFALSRSRNRTSSSAAVGRLALQMMDSGAAAGEGMSPLYIRPPDAVAKSGG